MRGFSVFAAKKGDKNAAREKQKQINNPERFNAKRNQRQPTIRQVPDLSVISYQLSVISYIKLLTVDC